MERVMRYLNRVYRASVLDRAEAFAQYKISGPQLSYILQICHKPGLSQDELAARLYVHKSSVARHVAQLMRHGFVRREEDPEDRRRRLLFPTEKALGIFPEIWNYLDEWNELLLEGLSEEEKLLLLKLMKHLVRQAEEHVNTHHLCGLLGLCAESEAEADETSAAEQEPGGAAEMTADRPAKDRPSAGGEEAGLC